jgi:hypothetical protein
MRGKAGLVVGLAIGYVLGTRAGRERYEQIKGQWLKVWNMEPVQEQVGKVKDFAKSSAMALPSTLWDSAVKVTKAASSKGTPGQRLDAAVKAGKDQSDDVSAAAKTSAKAAKDATSPRGFRDRADDSLLTLLGDVPELIRNLVIAEVESAKKWVARTAKDGGWGALWMFAALFVLFWSVPVFGTYVIAGLSSWWPVWLSALVVFFAMIVVTAILALLGILRFRKIGKAQNPVQSIAQDVKEVRDEL